MAAGVGASLVWGSAFAVPVLLGGWNPVVVTRHDTVSPAGWSTAVGVATGAVALAGLPAAALAGQLSTPASVHPGPAGLALVLAGVSLTITVSRRRRGPCAARSATPIPVRGERRLDSRS
jgi:hypothetical protein